jgi:hypothetical protein
MRNISDGADFEKYTRIKDNLYIRVLFDYLRYPLYDEDANPTPGHGPLWASLLVLQEIYQQGIAAIYEATGSFPSTGQSLYGFDSPCVIEEISYVIYLDGVVVNFACKEDVNLDSLKVSD